MHRGRAPMGATDGVGLLCVALYEARCCVWPSPRPHEVFDLCALGLIQVKASGLVQASGLLLVPLWPAWLSGCFLRPPRPDEDFRPAWLFPDTGNMEKKSGPDGAALF